MNMNFSVPERNQYENMLGMLANCQDYNTATSCVSSCRGCSNCISSCRGCSVVVADYDVWEVL